MKIYSAQHRAIVEAPIMEKPDPQLYLTVKDYEVAMLTYEKRLTSYPPIPVLREHQNLFKDGQEVKEGIDYLIETVVTGGRSIKSLEGIPYDYETYTKDFALPIKQQVSEEDKEPLPQQERWRLIDPNNYDSATQFYSDCWKSAADELSEALAKIKSQEAEIADLRKQIK
jgi:hypothetical protein